MTEIERDLVNTQYERLRVRDDKREVLLRSSIMEQGILDPLYVVNLGDTGHALLDGFKRYRCAVKLNIPTLPVVTLEKNPVIGIVKFLRLSVSKGLAPIEEAGLVDELHMTHGLSVLEIASRLERSAAWVSLRLGLMNEISDDVREKIFLGQFPIRSYMYSLRPFTRVKDSASKKAVSSFVACVAGKGLGTRDIDRLAQAYFKGGDVLKSQIEKGELDWTLRQLKEGDAGQEKARDNLSELESRVLSQLETVCAYSVKLSYGLKDTRLASHDFFTYGTEVAQKALKNWDGFHHTLQEFYDSARAKRDGRNTAWAGQGQERDCQAVRH